MDKKGFFSRTSKVSLHRNRKKNKLLLLLVKRILDKVLKVSFDQLKKYYESGKHKIYRMGRISIQYQTTMIIKSWIKLKSYRTLQSRNRIHHKVYIFKVKIQKLVLKGCFKKILTYSYYVINQIYLSNDKIINIFMLQCIKKLSETSIKNSFKKLKQNFRQYHKNKQLSIIVILISQINKRNIMKSWCSLLSVRTTKKKNSTKIIEQQNYQLQDMRVQIENKNESIIRLQQQITQLKQNSISSKYDKIDSNSFCNNTSFWNKSGSQNKSKLANSFDKDSNDGNSFLKQNGSLRSLLGISILSYRSRDSSLGGSKIEQCICNNCRYKEKYMKYKINNDCLKKNLQIIKTQLQFTKDMNQHLENEIRNQLTNEEKQQKIQKLKLQLKQCNKDRQILSEKILKYEKYTSKLKIQFKNKLQQIYRKIKKGS